MAGPRLVVIGAGGFAREVRWLIEEIARERSGGPSFVGYVVSDLSRLGPRDSRAEVLGDYAWLRANRDAFDGLALGIGAPAARLKVASELEPEFPRETCWPPLLHPSVRFDAASAEVGPGVIVVAGTVGTVNLVLRAFCMVNGLCTLGHEAEIGEGSVINPSSNVSGGVVLGRGVLVGAGAQLLQYVQVGDGATIGAGAVVTKDVPAGVTVVGIPARPLDRAPLLDPLP